MSAEHLGTDAEREATLRRHNAALVELSRSTRQAEGGLQSALREITQAAADTLEVERVGIWMLDKDSSKVTCADLYERTSQRHSMGAELLRASYPGYFSALDEERTIAASDAKSDSRTAEFRIGYLDILGIGAMLDAPIRVAGKFVGIICHEHVGGAREWTSDEQWFGGSAASFVAMAVEEELRRLAVENENRQKLTLRQILDGLASQVWLLDTDARVIEGNATALRLSGMTNAETAGRTIRELAPFGTTPPCDTSNHWMWLELGRRSLEVWSRFIWAASRALRQLIRFRFTMSMGKLHLCSSLSVISLK